MLIKENSEYEHRLDDANRLGDDQKTKIKDLERLLLQMNESHSYLKGALDTEIRDIQRFKQNRDETWASLVDLLDK